MPLTKINNLLIRTKNSALIRTPTEIFSAISIIHLFHSEALSNLVVWVDDLAIRRCRSLGCRFFIGWAAR